MTLLRHYFSSLFISCLVVMVLFVPSVVFADDGLYWAQNLIWKLVVNITGLAVGLGGIILDYGINTFVIGFGDLYRNSGLGVAVNNVWVILRDFINLGFIFGLVYIGFRMILDSSNSNTRRWLVNLIIAAILINFSLLATKFVIDFTNELAAQIAVQGFNGQLVTENSVTQYKVNMSAMLLNKMGAASVFSSGQTANLGEGLGWGYIFGTGIMLLVTGFVFAAGGIILIIRFIALHLFMVLSPLMFIGWVLPVVSDKMSEYWKEFLGRAFVAPVYLLLLYLSVKIIDGLQAAALFNPSVTNMSTALSGGAESLKAGSTIPFFILICGFLIASLKVADKMGADGAGQLVSYGKSLSNKAQRGLRTTAGAGTFGLAARVGRNTVGQAADNFANSERGKRLAASGIAGRTLFKTAGKVADSNFDVRSVGGLGKELGIGEGRKGGYQTAYKEKLKKEEEFLESIKISEDDAKEGSAKSEVDDFKVAEKKYEDEKEKEEKSVARDRVPYDNEINRLKALYAAETDKDKKEALAKDMEQQRGFIKDIKDQSEARVKVFEKSMKEAEKKMNEAITNVQYQEVERYLQNQEKWSEGKRRLLRSSSIGAATIGASTILGPLGGGLIGAGMAGEFLKDENIKKDLRKKIEGEKKKRRKGEKPAASTSPAPAAAPTSP